MPMNDLISRSALKKYMNDYRWEFCMRGDFAKAVEMVDCAPTVDAGPKWISVKDKLPERNKRVLVAFKDGMVTTSMRTLEQHTGVFGFLFEGDYGTATHWMPLPEPPKEG